MLATTLVGMTPVLFQRRPEAVGHGHTSPCAGTTMRT
jgi:hypothetical protein